MVVGKDNKITVAVRSAIGMEVPLQKVMPDPIVSEEVIVNNTSDSNIIRFLVPM
jgi:hypothetical protein